MDVEPTDGSASLHDPETFTLSEPVVCLVGPTASGKTDLAQKIAYELGGEVVSADSMQVYRGMDIGTGKIPPSDRLVTHHGLDLVDPGEPYSAALFQTYARKCFHDIDARGKRAVMAGGTGFYIRAAIDGYEFPRGGQVDNPVRERCQLIADERGPLALWEFLRTRDPESAAIIPVHDVKRVVRAFELLEEGTTYATQRARLAQVPQVVPARFIGLAVTPELLARRIDARTDDMMEAGLVDEVKRLLQAGFRTAITASQAIGYKEIVAALDGETTLEEAVSAIKSATRRYAKRQRTWFRKDKRIVWLCADSRDTEELADRALATLATMDDGTR